MRVIRYLGCEWGYEGTGPDVMTYRSNAVSARCRWGAVTQHRPYRAESPCSPTCGRLAGGRCIHLEAPAPRPPGSSTELSIIVSGRPGRVVVEVGGELDLHTAGQLRTVLTELAADGHGHVVVDFAGVTFCDAAGLGALVAANNRLAERGGTLRLVGVRPAQRKILHVTRLNELFPVYETVDEAARF